MVRNCTNDAGRSRTCLHRSRCYQIYRRLKVAIRVRVKGIAIVVGLELVLIEI
jgi:hypothetical protein